MKNFWAIHCRDHVAGMENCMDSEEDHHPGRLAGPTERIPKLVHDIIHQNERDAVEEIFELDGITGFNPGRWTGKNIPEKTFISHNFNLTPLSSVLMEIIYKDMEEKERKEEKQREKEERQETIKMLTGFSLNRNEEKSNMFLSNNWKSEWEDFSSLPKRNFVVNVPSHSEVYIPTLQENLAMNLPSYSEVYVPTVQENLAVNPPFYSAAYIPTVLSFEPAFCLGGSMDREAMERKAIPYGYSHPMVANAPNGYGGGPVLYTPSGWQPV